MSSICESLGKQYLSQYLQPSRPSSLPVPSSRRWRPAALPFGRVRPTRVVRPRAAGRSSPLGGPKHRTSTPQGTESLRGGLLWAPVQDGLWGPSQKCVDWSFLNMWIWASIKVTPCAKVVLCHQRPLAILIDMCSASRNILPNLPIFKKSHESSHQATPCPI